MSKQFTTRGIVLTRTNYSEADRIITFLTPTHGKVSALAKAVRKSTSKLAGGIELFSVSELTFIEGRGNVNTLISSRLVKHYGNIVKNLDRTNAGYELIKVLNKVTEDHPELDYFDLLNTAFAALDNTDISLDLVHVWFYAQLLKLAGHSPNLRNDLEGNALDQAKGYDFNFDSMSFQAGGSFNSDHIKFLRLIFSSNLPSALQRVQGSPALASDLLSLVKTMLQAYSS